MMTMERPARYNTMKRRLGVSLLAAALVIASRVFAAPLPDENMAGQWKGTADIVVNWTVQRTLEVEFTVTAGGQVTGRIGDARLTGGRLERNRGPILRAMIISWWGGWRATPSRPNACGAAPRSFRSTGSTAGLSAGCTRVAPCSAARNG
jgi:hypothetical protein